MNASKKWLNGTPPWEMSEDDFLAMHCTGYISSSAYEGYEKDGGLSWLGNVEKYPEILFDDGHVQFRKTGEKLKYCLLDGDGEIVRTPETGLAVMMSDVEIAASGRPTHDQTIVAFIGGEPIGLASNEFGAVGVWVEKRYQGNGIGRDLLKSFLDDAPHMKIGQMTNAGFNMTRSLHRAYVEEQRVEQTKKRRNRP